jgi:hypothetical protein
MLGAQIDRLVPEILPNARLVGREWCVGSFGGEAGDSCRIHSGGAKSGLCRDFSSGEKGGDALDLVALVCCNGDIGEAVKWARAWLGLDGNTPPPARPAAAPVRQMQREPQQPAYQPWRRILAESTAAVGTLAEIYLRNRGLRLPNDGGILFHAACPFGTERHPAMIAVMTDPATNQHVGIHRTAIAPDGSGKAKIASPKMMLGGGGVIRLTPDEDVTHGLGICEGIETGLAIIQRAGWSPIWAASSAAGIASFPVLAGIECLTVFADHDAVNRFGKQPGIDAARQCAARWHAAACEVHIKLPPIGLDWDDAFKKVAA